MALTESSAVANPLGIIYSFLGEEVFTLYNTATLTQKDNFTAYFYYG